MDTANYLALARRAQCPIEASSLQHLFRLREMSLYVNADTIRLPCTQPFHTTQTATIRPCGCFSFPFPPVFEESPTFSRTPEDLFMLPFQPTAFSAQYSTLGYTFFAIRVSTWALWTPTTTGINKCCSNSKQHSSKPLQRLLPHIPHRPYQPAI